MATTVQISRYGTDPAHADAAGAGPWGPDTGGVPSVPERT
jgi:hypothetical protein